MLSSPEDDHGRLRAVLAGSSTAFEELYARHAPACWSLARLILRDDRLAQDAVQEAFLDLWRGADRLDPERTSVGAWLSMLTRRRAIDRVRRESRQPLRLAELPDVTGPDDVERQAQVALLGERVVQLLHAVPFEQRRCLVLAYWGGYTMSEIADLTNSPVGTVKTRLGAAMKVLRAEFAEA